MSSDTNITASHINVTTAGNLASTTRNARHTPATRYSMDGNAHAVPDRHAPGAQPQAHLIGGDLDPASTQHTHDMLTAHTQHAGSTGAAARHSLTDGPANEQRGTDQPQAHATATHAAIPEQGRTTAPSGGTIDTTPYTGPMCEDIKSEAVAAPTESGVLSCPDSAARHVLPVAVPNGFGRGAPIRKDGGTASDVSSTPRPPYASEDAEGGFQTPEGARAMTTTPTLSLVRTTAPATSHTDTTDPQAIRLHIAAENALTSALRMLRAADCDAAKVQAATGRAIRAATALKRLCAVQMEGGAA